MVAKLAGHVWSFDELFSELPHEIETLPCGRAV
jgi:hypothetical protein